jgi:hypothetical protein
LMSAIWASTHKNAAFAGATSISNARWRAGSNTLHSQCLKRQSTRFRSSSNKLKNISSNPSRRTLQTKKITSLIRRRQKRKVQKELPMELSQNVHRPSKTKTRSPSPPSKSQHLPSALWVSQSQKRAQVEQGQLQLRYQPNAGHYYTRPPHSTKKNT